MPRRFPIGTTNVIFHAFNRCVRGTVLFEDPGDYAAFERILFEAVARTGIRLLAYCVMPNHWHLVVWPTNDLQLSQFMHWLTSTHAKRWQTYKRRIGSGAVYQSRYRAIPVQTENYFLTLRHYVERNPLRANLVQRAEEWKWSSLASRRDGDCVGLTSWPILPPDNWLELVNQPQSDAEVEALRKTLQIDRPLGDSHWVAEVLEQMGIDGRLRGRPRKDAGFIFRTESDEK